MLLSCSAPNVLVIKREGRKSQKICLRKSDLNSLFNNALPLAAVYHRKLGISNKVGIKQLTAIRKYMGL